MCVCLSVICHLSARTRGKAFHVFGPPPSNFRILVLLRLEQYRVRIAVDTTTGLMAEDDRRYDRGFEGRNERPEVGATYMSLPFFKPWFPRPAAGAAEATPTPPPLQESCGFKLIMGTVGGQMAQTLFIADINWWAVVVYFVFWLCALVLLYRLFCSFLRLQQYRVV